MWSSGSYLKKSSNNEKKLQFQARRKNYQGKAFPELCGECGQKALAAVVGVLKGKILLGVHQLGLGKLLVCIKIVLLFCYH